MFWSSPVCGPSRIGIAATHLDASGVCAQRVWVMTPRCVHISSTVTGSGLFHADKAERVVREMEDRHRAAPVRGRPRFRNPLALQVQANSVDQTQNRLQDAHAVTDADRDEHIFARSYD